jgi:hypothetical protein
MHVSANDDIMIYLLQDHQDSCRDDSEELYAYKLW